MIMMRFKINEDLKLIREMLELSQEEISLFIDVDKKQLYVLRMMKIILLMRH